MLRRHVVFVDVDDTVERRSDLFVVRAIEDAVGKLQGVVRAEVDLILYESDPYKTGFDLNVPVPPPLSQRSES